MKNFNLMSKLTCVPCQTQWGSGMLWPKNPKIEMFLDQIHMKVKASLCVHACLCTCGCEKQKALDVK